MSVVIDASVVVRWLLRGVADEGDFAQALTLMEAVADGRLEALQPPHWLAEVAAVITRLSPETAEDDVDMLESMELPVAESPAIVRRACRLAIDSRQHVFDTLYHAVALENPGSRLVTANERYFRKGLRFGHIVSLAEWAPHSPPGDRR